MPRGLGADRGPNTATTPADGSGRCRSQAISVLPVQGLETAPRGAMCRRRGHRLQQQDRVLEIVVAAGIGQILEALPPVTEVLAGAEEGDHLRSAARVARVLGIEQVSGRGILQVEPEAVAVHTGVVVLPLER